MRRPFSETPWDLPPAPDAKSTLREFSPAEVFGPGGYLAQKVPGYVPREPQIRFAEAVDKCFREAGNVLLAEAATGTGKSIGYLAPAIWHAVHEGKRVVVATANIALQEQLFKKDLPALKEALPWPFTFALAKGISNYLCRRTYESKLADASLFGLEDARSDEQWRHVVDWAAETELGDVSELPFEMTDKVRLRVVTTSEDCVGRKCRHFDRCGAMAARKAWPGANVIVTNYHLLFADIQVRMSSGGTVGLLPNYLQLVLDEGHNAADIARDFFGFRATHLAVMKAARPLGTGGGKGFHGISPSLHSQVGDASLRFFTELAELERSDRYNIRLSEEHPVRWQDLTAVLGNAAERMQQAAQEIPVPPDEKEAIVRCAARCQEIARDVKRAMNLEEPRNWVYYVDASGKNPALTGKPIDVSRYLREQVFDQGKSVVVTSATLVSSGGMARVAEDLGVDDRRDHNDRYREIVIESPFDWEHRAVLVMPAGMPEPGSKLFPEAAVSAALEAVGLSRGRALVLCTSRKMVEEFRRGFDAAGLPWTVMAQGDAPRTELLRRFKEDVSSILIGTDSFWEGVDVPGEALSLVVIDRLPFESPSDPVVDAVSVQDRNAFKNWLLPRAIVATRQGGGRLLRALTDTGAVVVLDRRLVDKPYGRAFVRALPPMPFSRDLAAVGRMLG